MYWRNFLPIPNGPAVCIWRKILVFHFAGSCTYLHFTTHSRADAHDDDPDQGPGHRALHIQVLRLRDTNQGNMAFLSSGSNNINEQNFCSYIENRAYAIINWHLVSIHIGVHRYHILISIFVKAIKKRIKKTWKAAASSPPGNRRDMGGSRRCFRLQKSCPSRIPSPPLSDGFMGGWSV